MFVTWRGSNNSHGGVRFSYNTGDDSFVQEEFQSWNSNADAALQRCGSCPIGFTNSTCCVGWQLVYAMSIFGDYGATIMDTYRGGVVGVYFYHLVSTPWGGAYASTNWGGVYRYDVSAFPILDRSSEWINNTTLQFFTFLEPPYVPTEWMGRQNNQNLWCFKDISFPFYNWTKIVIFETAYGLEGNFAELSRSEGVLLTNAITEINCSNKTNVYRARVKYIGDNNVNIYTLPSVIRCSDAPAECLVPASFNDIPPAPQNVPNIIPILECITAETTNNFTVYFGYNNTENSLYNVPIGPLNTFSATQDRGQTTNFLTGRSRYWPTTAFTAQFSAGTFSWRLTNYNLTFTTTDQSLACPTNITLRVTLRTSTNFIITQEELGLIGINIANQLGLDPSQVTVRSVVSGNKKRQPNSDISELEVEISTSSPNQNTPSQSPAQIVQNFVQITSNDTLAQQTFNPLNDTSRSVVSVDTTKTGREQSGSRVSDTNNQPTTEPSTEPVTNNQPKGTAKTPVVSEAVSFGNNIALFVGLFVVTVLKKIFI